jgi:glycogen(starch) synthase
MKILFNTVFHPNVGGMETMAEMLADQWIKAGVQVTIVTRVPDDPRAAKRKFAYPVVRNPNAAELLHLMRASDVYMHNAISLRRIWPLFFIRKPFVVRHGTWYNPAKDRLAYLKRFACRFATNISASEAVARDLPVTSVIIPNPYNHEMFHIHPGLERNKDLIFVGRLVTDKGVDTLLEALAHLKGRGRMPKLTVIGDGPERRRLEAQAAVLGLKAQVEFTGYQQPSAIGRLLCQHKVLVVPSRLNEPFGIVALEGIACGCAVIGSSGGGLPEAIGPCGVTFSNGDSAELAERIEKLLGDDALRRQLLANAPAKLESHQLPRIATSYLEVFQNAIEHRQPVHSRTMPMRILLFSRFYPNVGGIETGAEILAREWTKAGHHVTVATDVARSSKPLPFFPFQVVHQPSWRKLFSLVRRNDVFVHFNIRLRSIAPVLFWPSKFIATHHGFYWIDRTGKRDWRERLKIRIARSSLNIAVSKAVAVEVGSPCLIIPAPYNSSAFRQSNFGVRPGDLVYLGRLVSDKGVDVALRAMALLKPAGVKPHFTIIGDGPERTALAALAGELGITEQVTFTGIIPTAEVADTLNRHKILLVPSLWKEPFGLVAVEGIACGCVVIGSSGGGLPEAIGPCGITFPNGDVPMLARQIELLLTNSDRLQQLRAAAAEHVAKHNPTAVAQEYLRVFEAVMAGKRKALFLME